jgi:poly(A) polymerase
MSNELELPTSDSDVSDAAEARVLDRAGHNISRSQIPENVLKVLYRLHRSGYRAYLCGGSVRDLLMDREPKDFDIATDAHPMEIRRLFRNSRIIGRRFRLVHILFQDMAVEVSTFRKEPESRGEEGDLLVTNDNTFGSPLEDARRRDFTINGMFYNIADFSVIDYVGGLNDLSERRIRVIGDPDLRFREDPVRMMRAVEFASRLGFQIEPQTYDAILRHHGDILRASPARVTEEILELLRRGWSKGAIELLLETRLLESLVPELSARLKKDAFVYFWKMLAVLDRTVESSRKISDAVLLSVLFLPLVLDELEGEAEVRQTRLRIGEVILFLRDVLQPICQRMTLSAGLRHQLEQIFENLWRLLEPPADRRSMWRFVHRENFSDALALFELFALSSGQYVQNYRLWQSFVQRVRRGEEEGPEKAPPARRRRRGRSRPH